jgi:predicted Zn-dependent protease
VPLGFLKFSRGMEAEADKLGLEYMYHAGYDPTSFVDFFEKIQSMEKKKPGTISKLFASHPMTDDRIKAAQKEIQEDLKAQPEYVLDTSEFAAVQTRLAQLQNRRKIDDSKDKDRPTLRRHASGKIDANGEDRSKGDEDERPTLKRRE